MSAKFTPGPWSVDPSRSTISSEAVTDLAILNMGSLRYSWGGSDFLTEAHREANARLISAAPDLLEALKAVLAEARGVNKAVTDAARAAIAKATGESE